MNGLIDGVDLAGTGTCAAFNLRKASRAISQHYDAGLAPAGLRATQFAVLVAVAKGQPLSVAALAEVTMSDATTMTRNLRVMQAGGLIAVSARGVRREKSVRLTKKGERALVRAVPVWRALQDAFVASIGAGKWRTLRRELEFLTARGRTTI